MQLKSPREYGINLADTDKIRKRFRKFVKKTKWSTAYFDMHPPEWRISSSRNWLVKNNQEHKISSFEHGAKIRGIASKERKQAYRDLAKTGVPVIAKLMLVNTSQLMDKDALTVLTMAIAAFDDPLLDTCTPENDWTDLAWNFHSENSTTEQERSYAKFRSDESYQVGSRHRVPDRITQGRDAWLFHFNLVKRFGMPILNPYIVCLANPGDTGIITAIPDTIYKP